MSQRMSFLLGVLMTLLVLRGIQLGTNWLTPGQPKFANSQPPIIPIPLSTRALTPPLHEVPHNWGRPHQFNGQPYYIMPLAAVDQTF